MAIGQTGYPDALDDASSLIEVRDAAQTQLTAAVDESATALPVATTAAFPPTGVVTVDDEHIAYAGKTSSSFTGLTRGAFQADGGGAATAHASGALVGAYVTAATHRVQSDAIVALETKLGPGPATPSAGTFLRGTTAGSTWGPLTVDDVQGWVGPGPTGPQGPATRLLANGVVVGESPELDIVDAGNVTVTGATGIVQVALPRGPQGPIGPAGGAVLTVLSADSGLDQAAGSTAVVTHTCAAGTWPVFAGFHVLSGSTKFITAETTLAGGTATVRLSRSSASVEGSTVRSQCVCAQGTAG